MNFRSAFDQLWKKLFTSPVHLDSALSQAPPSQKAALAEISRLLLQRPKSLAKYLRFFLQEDEPWELTQEELAEWPTGREMANRLFQAWSRDRSFSEEGHPIQADFPPAMIASWKKEFGEQTMRELVDTLARPAPLSLRASRVKGRNNVLSQLNDSGDFPMRAKASSHAPFGFVFPEYVPVLNHPMFKEGSYEIQDEGSQVMALFALWPKEFLPMLRKVPGACREWPKSKEVPHSKAGLVVVDACAGAGGKTLAIADAMENKGQVFAYDVSEKKLEALRKRAKRFGLHNIKTVAVKEGKENLVVDKFRSKADVVLVDAPCSGWGVLRRNPDLKWRQYPEGNRRLEQLQTRLLDAYAPLVKPGGLLTYGLCTFRKRETIDQVEAFLDRHPDFHSVGGGFFGPGPSDGFFFHAFQRETKK